MSKIKLWYRTTEMRKTIMSAIGATLSFLLLSLGFQLRNDARNCNTQPEDMKYILIWMGFRTHSLNHLGVGQDIFIKSNCSRRNCYISSNINLFEGDLSLFDAIAFNGEKIIEMTKFQFPRDRFEHQKYVYHNQESSEVEPVWRNIFDEFFNWTCTYKLDSDIPYPYFTIKNKKGVVVGPNPKMEWKSNMKVNKSLLYKFQSKHKAAAWFVSHCKTLRRREILVIKLQKALQKYGLNVDVYGTCGHLKCSKKEHSNECAQILERDYFFYLAFENSFAEDYVTEKLLNAVQNNVVPIVYGGANYSRFLPPNSYLDARMHTPEDLAAKMYQLMQSPELYIQYFTWKQYYSYHSFTRGDAMCGLCSALNDEAKLSVSVYKNFREWWNPKYLTKDFARQLRYSAYSR